MTSSSPMAADIRTDLIGRLKSDYKMKVAGDWLRENRPRANIHPTVKPTDLMRYLCRLVIPPNGVVLDLFMGSGSTGKAAMLEGFRFIGCELSTEYLEIAKARIHHAAQQPEPSALTLLAM